MRYAIFLLLFLTCPAFAGEPVYTWRTRTDDPDRVYLYRDGTQIGGWCYRARQYRSFDGENWGEPSASAPVPPPDRISNSMPMISQSPPSRRLLRPVQSIVVAGVDAALKNFMETQFAPLAGEVLGKVAVEGVKSVATRPYYFDLAASARLFARCEMGGKLDDKPDSDKSRIEKRLMETGSARVFLAENAKFAEKLKKEMFSEPVLTAIRIEILDDDPADLKAGGSRPEAGRVSVRLTGTPTWNVEQTLTIAPGGRSVQLSTSRRQKDAAETAPVVVHCLFTFTAQKEGKPHTKTLSFDLYLETLEIQNGGYPWKVRNVQYK